MKRAPLPTPSLSARTEPLERLERFHAQRIKVQSHALTGAGVFAADAIKALEN